MLFINFCDYGIRVLKVIIYMFYLGFSKLIKFYVNNYFFFSLNYNDIYYNYIYLNYNEIIL